MSITKTCRTFLAAAVIAATGGGEAISQTAGDANQAAAYFQAPARSWPDPAVRAAGLPRFEHVGVMIEPARLKYNPCNDAIFSSVVRTDTLDQPLGKYYMYYAPHNAPGGICLAYADKLDGPWTEYAHNPVISRDWPPHHLPKEVDHVSSPHAIWIEEEKKFFLYYHGGNAFTRFASSSDGIHFTYGGIAVSWGDFDAGSEVSYARVHRYTIPGKDNRYIMLVMGNPPGDHRKIFLAWSKDGRVWQSRRTPLLEPRIGPQVPSFPFKSGQLGCAWYLPWQGRHFIVYHDYAPETDIHVSEIDATFEHPRYLGMLYSHQAAGPGNQAAMSPCFVEEAGKLYLFHDIGERLHNKIALAVAPLSQSHTAGQCPFPDPALPKDPQAVLTLMHAVADWQQEQMMKMPASRLTDWIWATGYTGFVALGKLPGGEKYQEAMVKVGAKTGWKLGPQCRFVADDIGVGQMYLDLYAQRRQPEMLAHTREVMDEFAALKDDAAEKALAKAQPKIVQHWTWCDALYMAPPVLAKLYALTGDRKYHDKLMREFQRTTDLLFDREEHLYFRDCGYFKKREANGRKVFWGRGNGWVFGGLANTLAALPHDAPGRPYLEEIFKQMASRLITLQQPDGLWRASLLDPGSFPAKEVSGSGLFCYGLAWGVNNGLLEREATLPAIAKAWAAMAASVTPEGKLIHVQPVGADPRRFVPESSEVYGVGAFLLAGSEVYKLMKP